jgi:hypothetical protein
LDRQLGLSRRSIAAGDSFSDPALDGLVTLKG